MNIFLHNSAFVNYYNLPKNCGHLIHLFAMEQIYCDWFTDSTILQHLGKHKLLVHILSFKCFIHLHAYKYNENFFNAYMTYCSNNIISGPYDVYCSWQHLYTCELHSYFYSYVLSCLHNIINMQKLYLKLSNCIILNKK